MKDLRKDQVLFWMMLDLGMIFFQKKIMTRNNLVKKWILIQLIKTKTKIKGKWKMMTRNLL